jgi:hypothetical protein
VKTQVELEKAVKARKQRKRLKAEQVAARSERIGLKEPAWVRKLLGGKP